MGRYTELEEMIGEELERIQNKGELNAATLAQAESLAHTLKCLVSAESEKSKGGYSEHYPYPYRYPSRSGTFGYGYGEEGGGDSEAAYARGRGRNARRDSRGRYSSEDGGESMDESYGRRY